MPGGAAPVPACGALVTLAKAARVRPARAPGPQRVVGGQPSLPGAWPAAVALETPDGWQFCGGTLVGPRCVLTAAHCDVRPGELAVVGREDLRVPGGRVPVTEVRTHELYGGAEGGHDVALAVLATPVDLAPMQLVDASWAAPGVLATVVGWGLTSEGGQGSPVLREAQIPVLADSVCRAAFPEFTPTMMCAGWAAGGVDTCQGDSGGGLFVRVDGQWQQAGVTSWGWGCARPDTPGYYSRVAALRAWIEACSAGCA